MEQAAAAVAKAQEEAKQAARRAAEAEKRAGRAQEQKKAGFKPTRAPAEYDDRRAQGLLGLGAVRPVK
jgi:hypothetical protein